MIRLYRISRTALIAIRACAILGELPDNEYAGAKTVAKKIGAGSNYLSKVLQTLCNQNILISKKGHDGGFRLAKSPLKIHLFEILENIDDIKSWEACFFGKSRCSDKTQCIMHQRWKKARSPLIEFFKNTKVADIMNSDVVIADLLRK